MLQPPSTKPYNLRYHEYARNSYLSGTLIASILDQIFKDKNNGFFIEAGALDGEYMSHTLPLERDKNWTGLLIEPDSHNFKELQDRNRKSHIINACISINNYPEQVLLRRDTNPVSGTTHLNHATTRISEVLIFI